MGSLVRGGKTRSGEIKPSEKSVPDVGRKERGVFPARAERCTQPMNAWLLLLDL